MIDIPTLARYLRALAQQYPSIFGQLVDYVRRQGWRTVEQWVSADARRVLALMRWMQANVEVSAPTTPRIPTVRLPSSAPFDTVQTPRLDDIAAQAAQQLSAEDAAQRVMRALPPMLWDAVASDGFKVPRGFPTSHGPVVAADWIAQHYLADEHNALGELVNSYAIWNLLKHFPDTAPAVAVLARAIDAGAAARLHDQAQRHAGDTTDDATWYEKAAAALVPGLGLAM